GAEADRETDRLAAEVRVARGRLHHEIDPRVGALERRQPGHEPVAREARQHAQPQHPALAATAERCARLLEPAKCGGDPGEIVGTLPGEPEPTRTTLEETHAQLVLQRPDLTADGRRGDAELVGG